MDVIDKLVREWSWRCDKGYPDINDPKDKAILDTLMLEYGIVLETNLSRSQLNKYNSRVYKFIDKFLKKEPFEMIDGKQIKISTIKIGSDKFDLDSDREEIFDTFQSTSGSIYVTGTVEGAEVTVSSSTLKKTAEFGGKGKGSGTKIEDEELTSISSLISKVGEGNPINIRFGGKLYEDIIRGSTVPKTPKADFTLDNSQREPLIFLSHKAGSRPKDFQQYAGFTPFSEYDEIKGFVNDVKSVLEDPTQMESGAGFKRLVEDEELIKRAVYGTEFTPGENFGIQNVTALVQGNLTLNQIGDEYKLESKHTIFNPELPSGEYAAMMYATFRKNRNQFDIKDVRFGIYPLAWRPSSKEI